MEKILKGYYKDKGGNDIYHSASFHKQRDGRVMVHEEFMDEHGTWSHRDFMTEAEAEVEITNLKKEGYWEAVHSALNRITN